MKQSRPKIPCVPLLIALGLALVVFTGHPHLEDFPSAGGPGSLAGFGLAASRAAGAADDPETTVAARREAFRRQLSGATLRGRWRLERDGKLGEEHAESYALGEVSHVEGDRWIVHARIQYATKDVELPVPVDVLWAGDTPVITVENAWLPGLGKYSARVLFHGGRYAGSWSAPDHGGLMSGVVVPASAEAEDETEEGTDDASGEDAPPAGEDGA